MPEIDLQDLIGKPFTDGGRGPDTYDCWGLVAEVFRRYGTELQDYKLCCHDYKGFYKLFIADITTRKRWEYSNIPIPAVVAIRFNKPFVNHVGVYIGEFKFLHTREKTGVVIERIDSVLWKSKIEGFYTPLSF